MPLPILSLSGVYLSFKIQMLLFLSDPFCPTGIVFFVLLSRVSYVCWGGSIFPQSSCFWVSISEPSEEPAPVVFTFLSPELSTRPDITYPIKTFTWEPPSLDMRVPVSWMTGASLSWYTDQSRHQKCSAHGGCLIVAMDLFSGHSRGEGAGAGIHWAEARGVA